MTFQDGITMVGAVIAAGAGLLNLWWQRGDRHDSFVLGFSTLDVQISPGNYLYVVNTSKHEIRMLDYGFGLLDKSVNTYSLPQQAADSVGEVNFQLFAGSLPPRAQAEVGSDDSQNWDFAYAYTTTQRRPRFAFSSRVPRWKRVVFLVKVWVYGIDAIW